MGFWKVYSRKPSQKAREKLVLQSADTTFLRYLWENLGQESAKHIW